jgi:hypothetical protein
VTRPPADDAIDRILEAVGHVPPGLDREQLRADLEGIVSFYRTSDDRRRKPKTRRDKVAQIIAKAEDLLTLIDGDDDWRLMWARHRAAINRLIDDARTEFPERLAKMMGVGEGVSAFENLIGRPLKSTYERHFGKRAGYQRDTDEAEGGYIDFAAAVLKELDITKRGRPYSRNSIATALSKVRKVRRKIGRNR